MQWFKNQPKRDRETLKNSVKFNAELSVTSRKPKELFDYFSRWRLRSQLIDEPIQYQWNGSSESLTEGEEAVHSRLGKQLIELHAL